MKSDWWIFAWTLLACCSFSYENALVNTSAIGAPLDNKVEIDIDEECSNYVIEKEYVLLENGSLLLPNSDTVYGFRTYVVKNGTAFLCVDESPPSTLNESDSAYNFSKKFLSCPHILVEPEEYEQLKNGSIYVDVYSKVFGPRDYYIWEHGVYICASDFEWVKQTPETMHDGRQNKFPKSFTYITYVGLMLSILSLLSHLAVFCLVSSVRNLHGCCLASLSVCLLIAYLCFLALALVQTTENCANLGISMYYFFLTAFFWMNVIAFDVWRYFRVGTRELRISSHKIPWRRFLLYSFYSWLVPGMLASLVKVADTTDLLQEEYRPSFGSPICWFGSRKALLVFFVVPLCVVMLLNAIFFLDVMYVISRATLKTTQTHEATLKKQVFMFMRLALTMGLTWIVGLVAGYTNVQVLWYLFIILNTLQGLFIFVVSSCSSKVKNLCFKKYRKHSKDGSNISVRTISQISVRL